MSNDYARGLEAAAKCCDEAEARNGHAAVAEEHDGGDYIRYHRFYASSQQSRALAARIRALLSPPADPPQRVEGDLPSWIVAARDKPPEDTAAFVALLMEPETDTLVRCVTEDERVFLVDATDLASGVERAMRGGRRQTFAEAVRTSGLAEEQQAKLLAFDAPAPPPVDRALLREVSVRAHADGWSVGSGGSAGLGHDAIIDAALAARAKAARS